MLPLVQPRFRGIPFEPKIIHTGMYI
jgi:hypothetical protein